MSDDTYRWQLSIKLGNNLLNVRAPDIAEFAQALRDLQSNAPEITLAAAVFDKPAHREPGDDSWPTPPAAQRELPVPLAPAPSTPPAPAPVRQATGNEAGPVTIGPYPLVAEQKAFIPKTGKMAGKPSSRWVAKLGSITASTFDQKIGEEALRLNGQLVRAVVEKNPAGFYDLLAVMP